MSTTKERIGRYVLLESVGRGAMGVVYRAEDPVIHRTVAVKVLPTAAGLTPQQIALARERFAREGQALGSLDHPSIIRVFDVGEDPETGDMYIVMEFVSGRNLETILASDTIDHETAVGIVGQLAAGLDAAHDRGIIHRDIKPSNVLVTGDGTAKLADFGITVVGSSALTQDIRELGTPAYMSPEQVRGKALDRRADLFSFGVLAYELLANRKPFEGEDIVSIAHAIAHATPPAITEANPELPRALDAVFSRILAKDPSDRFATAAEFHEALRSCLVPTPTGASATPAVAAPRTSPTLLGLAAVTVLAGVFALSSWGGNREAHPVDLTIPRANVTATPKVNAAPAPPEPQNTTQQPVRDARPPAPKPSKRAPASTSPAPGVPAPGVPAKGAPASRGAVQAVPTPKPPVVRKVAPAVVPVPQADVTISFSHRLRRGTLLVLLDGKPIFNEKFSKPKLVLIQTTVWDPLKAPAGGHTLSAEVTADDGKTYVSDTYTFEFPPDAGIDLRIGLKGDELTVKRKSG